ncbi:uncharacterized protein LOC142338660 [Convolutriloba macropyga]|uniref:uncharacterized protein LOC142338660 n=1 Tax=Convolutriloba macropyga TaxID=536237 RepID=UPI003F528BD1
MDEKAGYIPVDQQQPQPQAMAPYPATAPDVAMSSGEPQLQPPPYPVSDQTVSGGQQNFNSYPSQPPQIAAQQQPEAYQNQYPPYGAPQPGPPHPADPKTGPPPSGYPDPPNYPNPGPPPPAPGQVPPAVVVPAISAPYLGHKSATVRCQFCAATVTTETEYKVGSGTWLSCLAIFGIGILCTLFIGIGCILFFVCWVPCVIDECKDVTHYCPNCRKVISQRGALVLGR